jgi:hypothetical protein
MAPCPEISRLEGILAAPPVISKDDLVAAETVFGVGEGVTPGEISC